MKSKKFCPYFLLCFLLATVSLKLFEWKSAFIWSYHVIQGPRSKERCSYYTDRSTRGLRWIHLPCTKWVRICRRSRNSTVWRWVSYHKKSALLKYVVTMEKSWLRTAVPDQVKQRQAWLVLGWVTIPRLNHGTGGQPSCLSPRCW